jgi:hypothetical protein
LAFSYFHLKKYQNGEECCRNSRTMMKKLKVDDKELEAGQEELWTAIRKALGKTVTNMAKKEESDDE